MRGLGKPGNTASRILASVVLIASAYGMRQPSTHAARTQGTDAKTLSVYTCCGSLSGFGGSQAGVLSSVRSIYGDVLSAHLPGLQWRETPFSSQSRLMAQLANAVRRGSPPDLVFIQGGEVGYAVAAAAGAAARRVLCASRGIPTAPSCPAWPGGRTSAATGGLSRP